jgi:hypothetical protein
MDIREELKFIDCLSIQRGGCWLYKPTISIKDRYGKHRMLSGERIAAHRFAYTLWKGYIGNLCVLHTCDTPRCCNPKHLFLGTLKNNSQDRENKQRGNRPIGEKHYASKLTEKLVLEMRLERKEKGTTYREFSERYGVHISSIEAAIGGRKWKSVSLI